jgi:ABC-2 type transport system permease protein
MVRAEWTKLRTAPGTLGLLLAVVGTTVGVSALVANAVTCPAGGACALDPVRVSLTGVHLGQSVVAIVAVLAIGGEYSTGMVRTTFTAMPRRFWVLVAKAAVVAAAVTAAAALAVPGALAAGRLLLTDVGVPAWSVLSPGALRAAAGSVLYLVLIALLSLGIGATVRSSAAAIGVVLGLLYVYPILIEAAADPWRRRLEQIGPTTAGLNVQATTGLDALALGPWAGLGVLAAWAAGALLLGGALLTLRDA